MSTTNRPKTNNPFMRNHIMKLKTTVLRTMVGIGAVMALYGHYMVTRCVMFMYDTVYVRELVSLF